MKKNINKNIEFETYRMEKNLKYCHTLAIFSIIFSSIELMVNLFDFRLEFTYPTYFIIYVLCVSIIWLIVYHGIILKQKFSANKTYTLLYYLFYFPTFYLHLYVTIVNIIKTGSPSFYTIQIMLIIAFVFLNLKETLLTIVPSIIILFTTLLWPSNSFNWLVPKLLNITTILSIALYSFYLKYKGLYTQFKDKENLLNTMKTLEEANSRIMEYDKSRTCFFTNISHDLKTPINVIYSAEQLLVKQLQSSNYDVEKVENYTGIIKKNSFRLIRLVNNLLDITKIDDNAFTLNLENIDIIYVVESIVDSVVDFIKSKGLDIIFDTTVEEKIVAVDEAKLERIILNLLSNAIKFTDKGDTIFVNISEANNTTIISIKDTGIGIEESMCKKIFERFTQSDKSVSRNSYGTGIGLSLVKSLMQLHNGDITLKTKLGEGSEFTLYFPDKIIDAPIKDLYSSHHDQAYNNKVEKIQIELSDIY